MTGKVETQVVVHTLDEVLLLANALTNELVIMLGKGTGRTLDEKPEKEEERDLAFLSIFFPIG